MCVLYGKEDFRKYNFFSYEILFSEEKKITDISSNDCFFSANYTTSKIWK